MLPLHYRLKLSLPSKPSVPTVSLLGAGKVFTQPHVEVKQHSLGTCYKSGVIVKDDTVNILRKDIHAFSHALKKQGKEQEAYGSSEAEEGKDLARQSCCSRNTPASPTASPGPGAAVRQQ